MCKNKLNVSPCKREGKPSPVSKCLVQIAIQTYLYTPVSMMNRFMSSSPNPHPPTQNTSSATYTCHPIQVPKKKPPSPPSLQIPLLMLPPPTLWFTSGRMLSAGSKSSSSSSLCTALRLLGYGDVERLLMSMSGTAGCSSESEFLLEWLRREPSICAYCSMSE